VKSEAKEKSSMCGRFTRGASVEVIAEEFGIEEILTDLQPSFNIAPTQNLVAVIKDVEKKLLSMRWGLIPSWAKDETIGNKLINARAETILEKPSFKTAFKRKRCLIVADGFYEWKADGKEKTPYFICLKSKKLFAFAGLYDVWRTPEAGELTTCTIITTEANEFMQKLHHRMPVILTKDGREAWLDTGMTDQAGLLELLKPYDAEALTAHAVSKQVNSPGNNSPRLILPGTP
jgi:putative SOS response-associated peptidase YedK